MKKSGLWGYQHDRISVTPQISPDPHRVGQPCLRVSWSVSPLIAYDPLCVVGSILFFQKFPQITSMAHEPTEAWALDSELGAIWEYKQTGQGDGDGFYGDGFSHFFVCVGARSSMEGNLRPDSWRSVMVHLVTAIAAFGIPRLPH